MNEGEPLWLKDKKNIKKEDYNQFYKNISFNYDNPLKTIHYNAEGIINYTALMYFPNNQPYDLFNSDRKNKIKLYVKKIFITDECDNIIPKLAEIYTWDNRFPRYFFKHKSRNVTK